MLQLRQYAESHGLNPAEFTQFISDLFDLDSSTPANKSKEEPSLTGADVFDLNEVEKLWGEKEADKLSKVIFSSSKLKKLAK